jgi:hypothetical protein
VEQALQGMQLAEEVGEPNQASYAMWRLGDSRVAQRQQVAAAALPVAAVTTAQACGRSGDLWQTGGPLLAALRQDV